jgi:hypothetical protein
MTAMRKAFALGLAAVMVLALGARWSAPAQEDARTKVLGVWKGTFMFAATAPAVMEFFEDHGVLKWKCSYTTSSRILWGEAEGTVTDFSPPKLEGTGVYTKHQVSGAEGTRVKFRLTLDDGSLKGTATPELTGIPADVVLSRAP